MKKFLTLTLLVVCVASTQLNAQVKLSLNLNIGDQPAWGPTGYDRVNYYYLPDVGAYYDVSSKQFIYQENNKWVFRSSLPGQYRNYDLYNGYKVVVNEPKPYLRDAYYRSNYAKYRNWHGNRQQIIRDSREAKYKPNRDRWERENKGHDRDRDPRHH